MKPRRAKGGHLTHLVLKDGVALCGHRPSSPKAHHFARAGWSSQLMCLGRRPCERCREIALKRQAEVIDALFYPERQLFEKDERTNVKAKQERLR